MIDIVYNGIKGKFMSDDEFEELKDLLSKNNELINRLELEFFSKKIWVSYIKIFYILLFFIL